MKTFSSINWKKCKKVVLKIQKKIIAAYLIKDFKKVFALQKSLISTFEARALAVRWVTSSKGKDIAGIDNKVIKTDKDKYLTILDLKKIKKPKPLKGGKIPTMYDRIVQVLYLFALEPIVELKGDERSYGGRLYRSAQDVQRYLRQCLALGNRARNVLVGTLTGDIKEETSKWIIDNIPLDRGILKEWLSKGHISWTLAQNQDGFELLSSKIVNMILDGMQEKIEAIVKILTKEEKKKEKVKDPNMKVNFVRYINKFVLTGKRKRYFKEILDNLTPFLKERGISKSDIKIVISKIEKGFDFLHFNFRKYKTTTRANNEILLIKPTKGSIQELKDEIRLIFKQIRDPFALISKINPLLQYWGELYKYTNAKRIFTLIDTYVITKVIQWIRKVEGHKQFRRKLRKYISKEGNRSFIFKVERENKIFRLFRLEPIEIKLFIMVRNLNPFLNENLEYFKERESKLWLETLSPMVCKLVKRQNNICPVCEDSLLGVEEGNLEVHHIQPRKFKGTNEIKNLLLLHKVCHSSVTNCKDPKLIAEYKAKGIIK